MMTTTRHDLGRRRFLYVPLLLLAGLLAWGSTAAAQSTLRVRDYYPGRAGLEAGYYLAGPGLTFRFVLVQDDTFFYLTDESGCVKDHYAWAGGSLYLIGNTIDCPGREYLHRWAAPPFSDVREEMPVSATGQTVTSRSAFIHLDRDLNYLGREESTGTAVLGIIDGAEVRSDFVHPGGGVESIWLGQAPLCTGVGGYPGVTRYRLVDGAGTVLHEVALCWRKP